MLNCSGGKGEPCYILNYSGSTYSNGGLVTCSVVHRGALLHAQLFTGGPCYMLNYSGNNGGLVTCSIVQKVRGALLRAQLFRK